MYQTWKNEVLILDEDGNELRMPKSKPTKTQIANEGIKAEMLDLMQSGTSYLISDMMKMFPTLAEYPSQKIVALMRQLVKDEKVVREEIKGKAYFTKV